MTPQAYSDGQSRNVLSRRLRSSTAVWTALLALGLTTLASVAHAEVVRFEVLSRVSPALEGRTFGAHGAVEKITGRATIAVDPAEPRNAVIADIGLAPRTAEGRVEAVADVEILRPLDGGTGTILVEAPNRGRKLMSILFDETADAKAAGRLEQASDAGNGFLLSEGYTLVWVGWQGDLSAAPGTLRVEVPGLPGITGLSREEFVFDDTDNPVTKTLTYPAASIPGDAKLTVRAHPEDERQTPRDLSFRFTGPQEVEITRPAGFDAGAIYELIYTAKDPLVLGLGFAVFRDVASFLRRETSSNPLEQPATHAYAHGVSQSGRFLRDFLYWGFNEDERGRIVFDAINPHVPGTRRTYTNLRFAQPGRNPSSQTDRLYPADQFPFSYAVTADPISGRQDGLLLRCRLSNTCPKVIETDSEAEFFGSRASLLVTDTRGHHIELPPEVRAYMIAGHPHFADPGSMQSKVDTCALWRNPLHAGAPMRALLVALDQWVRDDIEPPASRYPMLSHGTLAPAEGLYAEIPGLPYTGMHTPAYVIDAMQMPPVTIASYPVLFPRMDPDGLAIDGIRLPVIEVPRATYTGWNPRAEGFGAGALCTNQGAVVPFAATREQRLAAGDPRPSLEERYPSPTVYVEKVRQATERLVAERLLLAADAAAMIAAAEAGHLARLE
jgi:Alpha/beta hydrolase domain